MLKTITHSTSSLFWTLHIGGWTAYALLNYLVGIEVTGKPMDYFVPSGLYALGGIGLTLALRALFRRVWDWPPLPMMVTSGLCSILVSTVFTAYRSFVYLMFYARPALGDLAWQELFNPWDLYISLYVIGTWSGLYFGVKYYHTARLQGERLLQATAAAQAAQLEMLRYQLNPHFLFNTLNAITTLILDDHKDEATRMVTHLGIFLRHGLGGDPARKVTLEEELEVTRIYLSIEKMRYQDLLEVEFNIDPDAGRALVPAMLVQPLVENAVRHGVAESEAGGMILIAGCIEGGKLCVRVADSARSAGSTSQSRTRERIEAGIDSLRERLSVLYGEGQTLRLETVEPNGLAVGISIPLECNDPRKCLTH